MSAHPDRIRFESYEVDTTRFELRFEGQPVAIEPRVLSLLVYLIANRGRVVSKNEIHDELWGHRFVSEAALTTQLKALRRIVGDSGREQRVIKTVRGRGYQFVGSVEADEHAPERVSDTVRLTNLGTQRTPLFGRDADLERCESAIANHRMVTLLGLAGTGKTALAKAVGRRVAERYGDGVWFVDLVPVSDGAGIDYAIANTLGLRLDSSQPRAQLADLLCERELLLVCDNCEHIEDEVAAAMDHLLEFTREPRYLMTSRDPIDLADEYRLFLDPLAVESEAGVASATELFVATAKLHGVEVPMKNRRAVAQVCRQLDGLPLAIELAAAQLRYLSLDELGSRLDRRFELLTGRMRVGSGRQENLASVLAETWALLIEDERALIALLAAFPASFDMQDAETLLATADGGDVAFAMSRFTELCLLSRTSGPGARWRLLESVRMFALEQTSDARRRENARRHADWCRAAVGEDKLAHRHDVELARWVIAHYEDVVAAQDWYFAAGDIQSLTTTCSALALTIQLDEGVRAREQLDRIERYLGATTDPHLLSRLHAVAGVCGMILAAPEIFSSHAQAGLDAARESEDPNEVASQLILVAARSVFVDPALAIAQLDEAADLARSVDEQELVDAANSFRAWCLAMAGRYAEAREYAGEIAERNFETRFNNLTFNAVCALIASAAWEDPVRSLEWTERLAEKADTELLWSAQLLIACIYAINDRQEDCLALVRRVRKRLGQAGWDGLPDLLVPAALLAHAGGDDSSAAGLLAAVKSVGQPLQSFHVIAMYRQARQAIPREDAAVFSARGDVSTALEAVLG